MATAGEVQPLRIQKSNSNSSITSSPARKMASPARPLTEVSPMGVRRNSPSFVMLPKQKSVSRESSPFDASPAVASTVNVNSPLAFWRDRDAQSPVRTSENAFPVRENPHARRKSLEKLKSAYRVSNSNMYNLETEALQRSDSIMSNSSQSGAPLSASQGNAWAQKGHRRSQSKNNIAVSEFAKPASPSKSPQKSSLSRSSRYEQFKVFDPEEGTWSEEDDATVTKGEPRRHLRQPKSVSFDQAPPQVNEYEMVTPDPSSVASGSREGSYDSDPFDLDDNFERGSSQEHDDSFDESLEDTGKTPVVLPEDWGFMSPKVANTQLADTFDDPFEGGTQTPTRDSIARSDSIMSNGERRPLPAIPDFDSKSPNGRSRSENTNISLSRTVHSPPRPASVSKAEILSMRQESPVTLDERLRLLALRNEQSHSQPREPEVEESEEVEEDMTPPQISRESIKREIRDRREIEEQKSPQSGYADVDPDFPVPSRETSSDYDSTSPKRAEQITATVELYDGSGYDAPDSRSPSRLDEYAGDESVIHHKFDDVGEKAAHNEHRMSLPEFATFGEREEKFGFDISSWMSPLSRAEPVAVQIVQPQPQPQAEVEVEVEVKSTESEERPITPPENVIEESVATPESVIHRPISSGSDATTEQRTQEVEEVVPEPEATIRAPGSKLKTRPSITPAELQDMQDEAGLEPADMEANEKAAKLSGVNRRRSLKQLDVALPSLNEELSSDLTQEFDRLMEAKKRGYLMKENSDVIVASTRQVSGDSKESGEGETAQVQKPVVAASPRKVSGKTWTTEPWNGKMRRQSTRRTTTLHAQRMAAEAAPPMPGHESAAQLQDQLTSVFDASVDEDIERGRLFVKVVGVKDLDMPMPPSKLRHDNLRQKTSEADVDEDERNWFQLTLDNGLHCVTTAWLELGKSAPINQEFELTVFDELDFSLTLQTKIERPKSQGSTSASSLSSPTKSKLFKPSALSNLFSSPKKRRELEKKQKEEEELAAQQKQRELETQRAQQPETAWDLLHNVVGGDGSFARAIVSLEDHEQDAFGRVHTVDVPCFNSWATEDVATTRSKHGGIQRRPPYKIGNLTLQMLYIPKPRGAKDEDMPQSMSSAVKQIKEAEANASRQQEGFLSQQGGDCPYWRRRFFRLSGSNLTSYHEHTRQRRANINLAKATKLIDDKSSLTQNEASNGKSKKGRRKSAFAEDEEGYMFVEEGFRIRFANGELIDFYADNRAEKEKWMQVLSEVVGKEFNANKMTWVNTIMAKRALSADRPATEKKMTENKPISHFRTESAPNSPMKGARPTSTVYEKPPPPVEKDIKGSTNSKSSVPSRPASPTKSKPAARESTGSRPASPTKTNSASRIPAANPGKKPHNAINTTPAATPRPQKEGGSRLLGKRKAVRSMIF